MIVTYDLAKRIASFNFFEWLLVQKALGATGVAFANTKNPKTNKWPRETVIRRYKSICIPGVALAGMTVEKEGGPELSFGDVHDLVDRVRAGMKMPRLRSVYPPACERYTVTLRKTQRRPDRDSDEKVWREFANEIGAYVIEDYDVKPIHLHDRMALYAGAEMNFFVTNGPAMLGILSEYPTAMFDCQNSPITKVGVPLGEPYPFAIPGKHFMIYEPDTAENIRAWFENWKRREQ